MEKLSWGLYPRVQQNYQALSGSLQQLPTSSSLLPYGLGRSYGDSCLNHEGTLLLTEDLDKFIEFNEKTGELTLEAGATLEDILLSFVPRGWFLPVTPGTKFVTVGGAIANDVHGKNHHSVGSFGHHIKQFTLLRSDIGRVKCSPHSHPELFYATIGGLGLTGLIVDATLQLIPIKSSQILQETLPFFRLDEFFQHSQSATEKFDFNVAWIDCFSNRKKENRGLFYRGNFVKEGPLLAHNPHQKISVPIPMPNGLLNSMTVRAFNELYFQKNRRGALQREVHYDPFFYPLDAIKSWNRIYGTHGFYQYQCVLPLTEKEALSEIFESITQSQQGSFLAVLKVFGARKSLGMMSFPREGVTLALDFPVNPTSTRLLNRLDDIVMASQGCVYIAKDARMSPKAFQTYYPQASQFLKHTDPHFSSSFIRRVLK